MPTLLIASRNAHKAEEIAAILGDDFTVQTLAKFTAAPEVVEDGDTFAANAVKKATEIAAWLGGQARPDFVLADDSGLEVDALDGKPGVHSARYAGGDEQRTRRREQRQVAARVGRRPRREPRCAISLCAGAGRAWPSGGSQDVRGHLPW